MVLGSFSDKFLGRKHKKYLLPKNLVAVKNCVLLICKNNYFANSILIFRNYSAKIRFSNSKKIN